MSREAEYEAAERAADPEGYRESTAAGEPDLLAAVSCPICGLKVAGLLAALKEMRDAMAATMRVISMHKDSGGIIESMSREFKSIGIQDGFGVRAQQAVAQADKKVVHHYWTPDPTNRFCVKCGDNPLGSIWGVHRFQIQPSDPDFISREQI